MLNNNNNDKVINNKHIQDVVQLFNKDDSGIYYTCYQSGGKKI